MMMKAEPNGSPLGPEFAGLAVGGLGGAVVGVVARYPPVVIICVGLSVVGVVGLSYGLLAMRRKSMGKNALTGWCSWRANFLIGMVVGLVAAGFFVWQEEPTPGTVALVVAIVGATGVGVTSWWIWLWTEKRPMVRCGACGKAISRRAWRCPGCGQPMPPRWIVLEVVGLTILLMAIVTCNMRSEEALGGSALLGLVGLVVAAVCDRLRRC